MKNDGVSSLTSANPSKVSNVHFLPFLVLPMTFFGVNGQELLDSQLSNYRSDYTKLIGSRGLADFKPGKVDTRNLYYEIDHYTYRSSDNSFAVLFYHYEQNELYAWLLVNESLFNVGSVVISVDSLLSLERLIKNRLSPSVGSDLASGKVKDSKKNNQRGAEAEIFSGNVPPYDSLVMKLTSVLFPDSISFHLTGIKNLLIVPALNISSIPFQILKPWPQSNDYLIDRLAFSFADSFDSFFRVASGIDADYAWEESVEVGVDHDSFRLVNPVVVGNPSFNDSCTNKLKQLLGAEKEAREVSALLKTTPILNNAARKDQIVSMILKSNFIYLATHGEASAVDPLNKSWIALSQPNACGLLYTKEIQDWRKGNGLKPGTIVILSACKSGLGKTHEAGTIGISRAFTLAGAQNVTMSLWNVDDKNTAEIMKIYVEEMAKPQKFFPAENLRQAILRFKSKQPNPYYWAAFQNFGVPFPTNRNISIKP